MKETYIKVCTVRDRPQNCGSLSTSGAYCLVIDSCIYDKALKIVLNNS